MGWLSPYLPLLQSDSSPLTTGPISLEETSWIGAILCLGGVVGNSSFGFLCNWIGRKRAITLLAFPNMVRILSYMFFYLSLLYIFQGFWLCIMFGRYVYHLYFARFLAGCTGGGLFVCIPLFVAEIAEDRYYYGEFHEMLTLQINILESVELWDHFCLCAQISVF